MAKRIARTIRTPCRFRSDGKTLSPPIGVKGNILNVKEVALDNIGEEKVRGLYRGGPNGSGVAAFTISRGSRDQAADHEKKYVDYWSHVVSRLMFSTIDLLRPGIAVESNEIGVLMFSLSFL
jgi:hypothetical protein